MCLISDINGKFIAKTDIKGWKAVIVDLETGGWRGIYQNNGKSFPYDKVVVNNERKQVDPSFYPNVHVGGGFFHLCKKWKDAIKIKNNADLLYKGVFGAASPGQWNVVTRVVECVIPKGAECYKGVNGDYASRSILVFDKRKDERGCK